MRYREIISEGLPLIRGELKRVRGSYGALVITMKPENFLLLTASPRDLEYIKKNEFPYPYEKFADRYDNAALDFGRFPIPFLKVEHPSGRIRGHEGRHRALMISRQGGTSFPVVIYLYTDTIPVLTWRTYQNGEETNHEEKFGSWDELEARRSELDAQQRDPNSDVYPMQIQSHREGGETIKGSPSYTNPEDPWEKKPFTPADMPKHLVSEYDPSITVSEYRVGIVKGYRHFRA